MLMCLKAKLELVTGACCNSMIIEIYGKDDKFICRLDNDDALIGSYPVDDGARIHVIISINFHVFFSIPVLHLFSSHLILSFLTNERVLLYLLYVVPFVEY